MRNKLFIITAIFFIYTTVGTAQVVVIANKSVKTDKINVSALKDLYFLDAQSIGGDKVKLFDISSDNASKTSFYTALGSTSAEVKKVWLKAKLTGSGNPPESVGSEEDMVKKVASTPGAIGYVDKSKVSADVKVLLTL